MTIYYISFTIPEINYMMILYNLFLSIFFGLVLAALFFLDDRFYGISGKILFYYIFLFIPYVCFDMKEAIVSEFLSKHYYSFWMLIIINVDFIFNKCLCYWLILFFDKVNWKKTSSFLLKLSYFFTLDFIIFLAHLAYKFLDKLVSKTDNAYFLFFILFFINILVICIGTLYWFKYLFEGYSLLFFDRRIFKLNNFLDRLVLIIKITYVFLISHIFGISVFFIIFIYFFIIASFVVIVEAITIYKKDRISLNFLYWFYKNLYKLVYNGNPLTLAKLVKWV